MDTGEEAAGDKVCLIWKRLKYFGGSWRWPEPSPMLAPD
jgi:hypothetical protein